MTPGLLRTGSVPTDWGGPSLLQVEIIGADDGRPAATLVRIRGEIDIASAPALETVLRAADAGGATAIIVSLEDTTYCDSTVLALLAVFHRTARARLAIVIKPQTAAYRLFALTGFGRTLNVAATIDEALDGWLEPDPNAPG